MPRLLSVTFRCLARRPGLVVTVVLCLGLGLGVNLGAFGVVGDLWWDAPPGVADAPSLVRLYGTRVYPGAGPVTSDAFSYPASTDLEGATDAAVASYTRSQVVLGRGREGAKVWAELVSGGYFSLLGVRPIVGRTFVQDEARPGSGSSPVVLSDHLWRARFGGDPGVVGRTVAVGGTSHVVVGISPPGFSGVDEKPVDLWLSMAALPNVFGEGIEQSRGSQIVRVLLRVPEGRPLQALADRLTARYRAVHAAQAPGSPDVTAQLSLWPLQRNRGPHVSEEAKVALWSSVVALLFLLVAISNVSNLLIVRGIGRRQEGALRLALGAGRGELFRILLLESMVLTGAGLLVAVPVGMAVNGFVRRFLLPDLAPRGWSLDIPTLAFALGLALATVVLCGALVAFSGQRVDLAASLKAGPAGGGGPRGLRSGLLGLQVALAAILLVAAGLFLRSLTNVEALDLGVDVDNLMVVSAESAGSGLSSRAIERIFRAAMRRLEGMPGVAAASLVATPPFGASYGVGVSIPGRDELPTLPTGGPYLSVVDPGYFSTAGIRFIEGRGFRRDDHEPSLVVNKTLAKLVWGTRDPVGECLVVGDPKTAPCSRVLGVVEDTSRQRIQEPPTLQLYEPLSEAPAWISGRALVVRTAGPPGDLRHPIRRAVLGDGRGLLYVDAEPLSAKLSPQYSSWRLGCNVFSLFAVLAMVLSLMGVYAVTAYAIAQRRRELGIRLALGADHANIKRLLVGHGFKITSVGLVAGLAGGILLARALQAQLFEITPWDPMTLVCVGFCLQGSVTMAARWSARRAEKVAATEVLGRG